MEANARAATAAGMHASSALSMEELQTAATCSSRCMLHLPEPFSPPALRLSARLKPRAGLKTADHLGTKEASELKTKSVRRSAGLQLPFHFAYETFAQRVYRKFSSLRGGHSFHFDMKLRSNWYKGVKIFYAREAFEPRQNYLFILQLAECALIPTLCADAEADM